MIERAEFIKHSPKELNVDGIILINTTIQQIQKFIISLQGNKFGNKFLRLIHLITFNFFVQDWERQELL